MTSQTRGAVSEVERTVDEAVLHSNQAPRESNPESEMALVPKTRRRQIRRRGPFSSINVWVDQ